MTVSDGTAYCTHRVMDASFYGTKHFTVFIAIEPLELSTQLISHSDTASRQSAAVQAAAVFLEGRYAGDNKSQSIRTAQLSSAVIVFARHALS